MLSAKCYLLLTAYCLLLTAYRSLLIAVFPGRPGLTIFVGDGKVGDLRKIELVPNTVLTASEHHFYVPPIFVSSRERDIHAFACRQRVLTENVFFPIVDTSGGSVDLDNLLASFIVQREILFVLGYR